MLEAVRRPLQDRVRVPARRAPTSSASSSSAASAPRTTSIDLHRHGHHLDRRVRQRRLARARARRAPSSAVTENVFESVLETAQFEDKLYNVPIWSNTQLLWYRKDRVADAAQDVGRDDRQAEEIGPDRGHDPGPGQPLRGPRRVGQRDDRVGRHVDPRRARRRSRSTRSRPKKALEIMGRLAQLGRRAAEHRHLQRGHARGSASRPATRPS